MLLETIHGQRLSRQHGNSCVKNERNRTCRLLETMPSLLSSTPGQLLWNEATSFPHCLFRKVTNIVETQPRVPLRSCRYFVCAILSLLGPLQSYISHDHQQFHSSLTTTNGGCSSGRCPGSIPPPAPNALLLLKQIAPGQYYSWVTLPSTS